MHPNYILHRTGAWTMLSRILCFVFSAAAYAQTLATVTGEVRDGSGAVVAGAEIAVRNTETNIVRSVVTNEEGLFTVPALNPGQYEVKASRTGFKTSSRAGIELQVQRSAAASRTAHRSFRCGQIRNILGSIASSNTPTGESSTPGKGWSGSFAQTCPRCWGLVC